MKIYEKIFIVRQGNREWDVDMAYEYVKSFKIFNLH